jgi:hypothetical protein
VTAVDPVVGALPSFSYGCAGLLGLNRDKRSKPSSWGREADWPSVGRPVTDSQLKEGRHAALKLPRADMPTLNWLPCGLTVRLCLLFGHVSIRDHQVAPSRCHLAAVARSSRQPPGLNGVSEGYIVIIASSQLRKEGHQRPHRVDSGLHWGRQLVHPSCQAQAQVQPSVLFGALGGCHDEWQANVHRRWQMKGAMLVDHGKPKL